MEACGSQRRAERSGSAEPTQPNQKLPASPETFHTCFMLNFPALTVQLVTHSVTIVTSLIRLQELSGWRCSLMLCGRWLWPRTEAPVCYFLRGPEDLSLCCAKMWQMPSGPCCWRLSLTLFILHFSGWQVTELQRPNNLDPRKEETCKSAFWSHGQPERD